MLDLTAEQQHEWQDHMLTLNPIQGHFRCLRYSVREMIDRSPNDLYLLRSLNGLKNLPMDRSGSECFNVCVRVCDRRSKIIRRSMELIAVQEVHVGLPHQLGVQRPSYSTQGGDGLV